MRRRDFICSLPLVVAAAALPCVARAQPTDRFRRIGVLMDNSNDQEGQARVDAFRRQLERLGWVEGDNARIDSCWADADLSRAQICAADQVSSKPDVILAGGPEAIIALRQATQTVPIVFVQIGEPVESGVVPSLAHPGGNMTGVASFEYSIGAKWLQLLWQITQGAPRAAVLRSPGAFTQPGYMRAIDTAAPSFGMRVIERTVGTAADIESTMEIFARAADGLIILPGGFPNIHRELIISLAERHGLPAVYPYRYFAAAGGLMSYGNNVPENFRQAAVQVDHILRGANAGDLPIQISSKFELVINLKTAKALDLSVPTSLLARADEVIE